MAMLTVEQLTVAYGPNLALKNLSLEVGAGEVVALIGPNGAGKSTLVRAVSGVVPAAAGRIRLDGARLADAPGPERARRITVVPQGGYLPPAFRVYQTVMLGRTPYLGWLGRTRPEDHTAVVEALSETGLEDFGDRIVSELSGGEQQRVLLARALVVGAPVLLLDEPTAHLDLRHQASIFRLVRELAGRRGIAVLMVMHDLNHAAAFADRIILVVNGEKAADGPPESVLTSEAIREVFGVRALVSKHPAHGRPVVLLDEV